jgi:redox-sensitive bicupin YhaK (pirin superfamily)
MVKGEIRLDDEALAAGDGVAITDTTSIKVSAAEESELLLFDMA